MAWTLSALGSLHGLTTAIAGITGYNANEASQVSAMQTFLVSEIAGVCTTSFNGGRLEVQGRVSDTDRQIQYTLIPLNLAL